MKISFLGGTMASIDNQKKHEGSLEFRIYSTMRPGVTIDDIKKGSVIHEGNLGNVDEIGMYIRITNEKSREELDTMSQDEVRRYRDSLYKARLVFSSSQPEDQEYKHLARLFTNGEDDTVFIDWLSYRRTLLYFNSRKWWDDITIIYEGRRQIFQVGKDDTFFRGEKEKSPIPLARSSIICFTTTDDNGSINAYTHARENSSFNLRPGDSTLIYPGGCSTSIFFEYRTMDRIE
ncbi:hypothetical protein ACFLZN_02410 [Nanoarchaeota archaeon]